MEAVISKNRFKNKSWGILLGVPAIFIAAFIYGYFPVLDGIPLCGVKHFLGIDCPGCGMTRSFGALAHLNFRDSIDFHPLGIFVATYLLYVFFRTLYMQFTGKTLPTLLTQRGRDIICYAFVVFLLLVWAIKLILISSY